MARYVVLVDLNGYTAVGDDSSDFVDPDDYRHYLYCYCYYCESIDVDVVDLGFDFDLIGIEKYYYYVDWIVEVGSDVEKFDSGMIDVGSCFRLNYNGDCCCCCDPGSIEDGVAVAGCCCCCYHCC